MRIAYLRDYRSEEQSNWNSVHFNALLVGSRPDLFVVVVVGSSIDSNHFSSNKFRLI